MAFAVSGQLLRQKRKLRKSPLRTSPRCGTAANDVPRTHSEIIAGVDKSIKAAVGDGMKMLEVQFPPVFVKAASAALNETMDANRGHTRELLRGFTANWSDRLCVAFPDRGEAKIAERTWEVTNIDQPFRISTIDAAFNDQKAELFFIVNPGFNVDEYLNLEKYDDKKRVVVVINGELDRIRGGYYPRLFYPKLHRVSERSLRNFVPTYFYKPLSNRGALLREYPQPWRLLFGSKKGDITCLIESDERPKYPDIERALREAVDDDR